MKTHSNSNTFKLKISIKAKFFLVVLLTSLLVASTATFIIYKQIQQSMLQNLRAELTGMARTASATIDGDEHKLLELSKNEDSPLYFEIKEKLKGIRKTNKKIRYVYTMAKTDDPNTWKFVVDAEEDPKLMSHLGDTYDISKFEEMQQAFDQPIADKTLTTDKWGTWLSGYAPIYNSKGQAVAILGMDMSAKDVNDTLAEARRMIIVPMLILLILPATLSLLVSWRIVDSLNAMIQAARKIADGDYDQKIPIKTRDEIGDLANALNHMAVDIRSRMGSAECMVMIDNLTDLYNHRYFHERLNVEVKRAERYRHTLSLILIDVDKFARFNKANGHTLGDAALRELADIVMDSIRDMDIAARYSGEKFAVILPETSEDDALLIAGEISRKVATHQFTTKHNIAIPLTIGIGVSAYPEHGESSQVIIDAAFEALKEAKRIGESQIISFTGLSKSLNVKAIGKPAVDEINKPAS